MTTLFISLEAIQKAKKIIPEISNNLNTQSSPIGALIETESGHYRIVADIGNDWYSAIPEDINTLNLG